MSDRAFMAYDIENQIADTEGKTAGKVYEKEVSLSTAQVKALNTTPITLVSAPGPSKVIEFVSAVFFLDHGGTDFASGGDLTIQTITSNKTLSDVIAASDLINRSADIYRIMQVLSADTELDVNEGLELVAGSDHTTGNGILIVKVTYRILDFN